jgi:putative SOS response-associated peptidase YedK
MKDRQGLAQLILTAIKDGRSPAAEFVLYLRSFQADRSSSRWFAQMASPQTLDYELTHALPDFAVVGLGASDDEELRIGASRLRVRADEWQNVVRKLMEQAKAIVIFPWRSAGVLYELVHIASDANLARKSLLLMPSHLSSSPWLSEVSTEARGVSEEQLAEEEWNASRESLARSRIEFPSYRSSGGIFDFHGWIVPLPANRDEFRQLVLAKVGSVGKGSTALVVGKQLSARLSAERFRVYVLPLGYFREELGEGILWEHGLGGRVDPFAFDVLPGRSTSILLRNKKRHLQWMSAQWGLSAPKGTHGTTEEERENLHTAVVIDETEPTNKYHDAFLNRRCLIPIHHWYERDAMDGEGCREVWRVYSEDNRPLPVAGIWQRTRDGTRSIEFAILAYDSVEALGAIHHRMPVILGQEGAKLWLAESVTNFSQLRLLFHPGLSLGLKTGQWRL